MDAGPLFFANNRVVVFSCGEGMSWIVDGNGL